MSRLVIEAPGVRRGYTCDAKPCGTGGYAEVFPATHKPTGTRVALKRLKAKFDEDTRTRMRSGFSGPSARQRASAAAHRLRRCPGRRHTISAAMPPTSPAPTAASTRPASRPARC
jgi:hypothetical protein